MNLTRGAYNKRQFVLLGIFLLFLGGIFSYRSMERSESPDYIVRRAQVITFMPGASPERVEYLVTDKIEKALEEMEEIEFIESWSKTGVSVIEVNILESYKEIRPIWDTLRRKVEKASHLLPDTAYPPVVYDEYGDVFGIVFSILGDGFSSAQIKRIAEDSRDEILEMPLVAKVDLIGAQQERIFIDYTDSQLTEIGLSQEHLTDILSKRNIITSGGLIQTKAEAIAVEPTGNYDSIDEIKETLIQIPQTDTVVKLSDIAHVYRGYIDPPTALMRTSGQPSVGVAISMKKGGNIIELGKEIESFIGKMEASYPHGITFEMVAFQPTYVTKKIDEFVQSLLQALLIVIAIMLLFLGVRTGLVVASLIPVVVMITLFIMYMMGIGLNQVTLASLIIALGMLVDNSIVVSEATLVKMESGVDSVEAAISSANELKTSLLTSSLTTAAAFLPVYIADSAAGEYVGPLFIVVAITLLTSWFIAMTMIPIFCIYFLKPKPKPSHNRFYTFYRRFLLTLLKNRTATVVVLAGVFIAAMFGARFVPKIFFPPADTPLFTLEVELPTGASIQRTEAIMQGIDTFITDNLLVNESREQGIVKWVSYVGSGGPRWRLQHDPETANPNYAYTLLTTTSFEIIPNIMSKLDHFIFNTFPDVKPKIRPLEEGTPVKYPVEIRIQGKDIDTLTAISQRVAEKLETIPGTRGVHDDWGLQAKKVVVTIDEARARRAHVTNADIARSLESAISGVSLTEYRENDKLIPIILRSVAAKESKLIGEETFSVYSPITKQSIPISQVADVKVVWQPAQIMRRNRSKTFTVRSSLQDGYTARDIEEKIVPWLQKQEWPAHYRWSLGGDHRELQKSEGAISAKLPIVFLIILILIMSQFSSLRRTFIILLTIPMAMIGVITGLLITHSYFGFMTTLGIISLAGIVINNAIVLLDRIKVEMRDNKETEQNAILLAAKKRFRPILLTTITTITSLIPLWYAGSLMWEPMTIAIIFGLAFATLLTLGIVPVLYSLLFKVRFK